MLCGVSLAPYKYLPRHVSLQLFVLGHRAYSGHAKQCTVVCFGVWPCIELLVSFVRLGANSVLHQKTAASESLFHTPRFTSVRTSTTSFLNILARAHWIQIATNKMPSLTNILLHSIAYMADKFPDKWMEKIPYYREREEEIKQEEREARRARKDKRRHSHSQKRSSSHRRAHHYDDDQQSDSYDEEDYDRRDRRRHRSLDGRRQHAEDRSSYRRSYNPADYAPVDRYGFAVQAPGISRPAVVSQYPLQLEVLC